MTSFALEPMFGSLVLSLLAAIIVIAVVWFVAPPTNTVAQRWTLFALRATAALLLLLTVFRPTLIRTDRRPTDATLAIAVDTSRSMTLPDGTQGDRWTRQRDAYRQLIEGLVPLQDSLGIQVLAYDDAARVLEQPTVATLDTLVPEGELTSLETALTASIEAAGGKPIAGIVLLGDGTQTANVRGGGSQQVAETLNSLRIPLWTIPIGPTGDTSSARDVAIESLPDSFGLFAGNQVDIPFTVSMRGLAGITIPLRLVWITREGERIVAAERTIRPEKALDSIAFNIDTTAPAPGSYRLLIEAEMQTGELITSNNSQTAFAEVRAGGGRILYLEGQPRLEQTFIRRALGRFPDLELTYQWIPKDSSNAWPVDVSYLLEPNRFDAFIIGDLDSGALGNDQWTKLVERVGEGAGLVTLGGYQAYERGGYAGTSLADALPITLDASIARAAVAALESVTTEGPATGQLAGPISMRTVQSHPITRLGDGDLDARWQSLPPLLGANRFAGPKIAPGVQVLLESPNEDPLMVIGEYGRGRTAALAFDSTWRWWRDGQDEVHRRFWRQLMLWLLDRDADDDEAITVELETRRFAQKATPGFVAKGPASDDPNRSIQWVAEAIDEQGDVTPLSLTTQASGDEVRGTLSGLAPGLYQLRVRDASVDSSLAAAEAGFQVIDESRELERPLADPVYLRQLADITRDQGGKSFSPDEIGQLIEEIAKRRSRAEVPVVEKIRLGDGPISGWIVFLLFAGAMTTEWVLRRRWALP